MRVRKRRTTQVIKYNRGQAMLLIALAFVGLVAFLGLAIDAGIVFAHIGHLRRGVDAASLSAANQLRQDWEIAKVTSAAEELILLNLPAESSSDLDVVVKTCIEDTSIVGCEGVADKRKLAQVSASVNVNLAFLPIIGWDSIKISAEAISEAASVDLMLVIDTSTSMAYDTQSVIDAGDDQDAIKAAVAACRVERGDPDGCKPFEEVRKAAKDLVDKMNYPFDRVGLVSFDRFAGGVEGTVGGADEAPTTTVNLSLNSSPAVVKGKLDDMNVYPVPEFDAICPNFSDPASDGDPRGCLTTNTAAGLMLAGRELEMYGRKEAVWVVVLLSDGIANAAYDVKSDYTPEHNPPLPDDWYCPVEFWRDFDDPNWGRAYDGHLGPWCANGGYPRGVPDPSLPYPDKWPYSYVNGDGLGANSDPDAAARFWADWVACYEENPDCATPGKGAVIFTIGLGTATVNNEYGPWKDAGEKLLRYIANVGFNGNPSMDSESDPCFEVPSTVQCGNYYFSPDAAGLTQVFNDIADRIFTRLTH